MKMCQPHWDSLRAAIAARGLWPLVAPDGLAVKEALVLQLEGRDAEAMPDPLMEAYWLIVGRATEVCGIGMFFADAEQCPTCQMLALCEGSPVPAESRYKTHESYMIDGPADAVRASFVERGLVPP